MKFYGIALIAAIKFGPLTVAFNRSRWHHKTRETLPLFVSPESRDVIVFPVNGYVHFRGLGRRSKTLETVSFRLIVFIEDANHGAYGFALIAALGFRPFLRLTH
jgi:hypothetical protein